MLRPSLHGPALVHSLTWQVPPALHAHEAAANDYAPI